MPKGKPKKEKLPPLPESTGTDLLKSVEIQKERAQDQRHKELKAQQTKENIKPEEAKGPDLVTQFQKGEKNAEAVKVKKRRRKGVFKPQETTNTNLSVVTARHSLTPTKSVLRGWYYFIKDSLKRKWVMQVVLGSVILIIGGLVLLVSSYIDQSKSSPIKVSGVKGSVEPVRSKINVSKVIKRPQPAKLEVKIKPSYLKIQGRGLKSKRPRIKIFSDGSSHYLVSVKLTGRGGRILTRRSYYKLLKLRTKESRVVDLAKLQLPEGDYRAEVEIEGFKRSLNFFVGTKSKRFKSALWRHKKVIAFRHQEERQKLISLAIRLERHSRELTQKALGLGRQPKKWRSYWPVWRSRFRRITSQELKTVGPRSAFKYVHPQTWIRMRELRRALGLAASNFNSGKDKSIGKLAAMQSKMSKLKLDCIKTSLW